MDATNSGQAVDARDETVEQRREQTPQRKPEKELLCTICNLRACWQAPATTADPPGATP